MQFEYSVYYWQNCWCPILVLLFVTLLLACLIFSILKERKDPNRNRPRKRVEMISGSIEIFDEGRESYKYRTKERVKKIARYIFSFIVIGCLISVNIVDVSNGGIFLLSEKEEDAIEMYGEIEEIFDPRHVYGKYTVNQKHVFGEYIVINGTKYYLMTSGDLKEGDTVNMKVLPRSRFVLEIQRTIDPIQLQFNN